VIRRTATPLLALFVLMAAAVSGCHRLPPPTPLHQLNAEQTHGYNVFQARCAVCHYERLDKPRNGPSLVGIFKKPYLPSGAPADDDRVTATILHGRNLMPAQPNIDPDDLAALLAYLHTV
jgi:mono/diheme cytochrome c family protein